MAGTRLYSIRKNRRSVPQPPIEDLPPRPRTRGDCENAPRPCPWIGCRHHLYAEVTVAGSLRTRDCEPDEMEESCSLDVAARGGATLERVGEIMNVTRERVRQLEMSGQAKIDRLLTSVREERGHMPDDLRAAAEGLNDYGDSLE